MKLEDLLIVYPLLSAPYTIQYRRHFLQSIELVEVLGVMKTIFMHRAGFDTLAAECLTFAPRKDEAASLDVYFAKAVKYVAA